MGTDGDPKGHDGEPGRDRHDGRDSELVERVRDLYRGGLSTRRIAEALAIGRRKVDWALRASGVAVMPRGAGRARPAMRHPDPGDLAQQLRALYIDARLTRRQVAEQLGLTEGLVRSRLDELGISTRTRGPRNREERRDVTEAEVVRHYQQRGLSADAAGQQVGVSHRILLRAAHEHGVPVRPSAAVKMISGPIELLNALYADPLINTTLHRHGVPLVSADGPIWQRFPEPVPLTVPLCAELYLDCGASTTQIELLTGQPATKITRLLRGAGVALRPPGGRSPFRRRWEQQRRDRNTAGAAKPPPGA